VKGVYFETLIPVTDLIGSNGCRVMMNTLITAVIFSQDLS
jgi:hypothetical protein